jgi:hypothetical protein
MKKLLTIVFVVFLTALTAHAQKAEVLYFKGDLSCCNARACNALELELKSFIENNYKNGDVVFRTVKISDPESAALVQKHNAKSQTVVVVKRGGRNEKTQDLSEVVKNYNSNRDKPTFERDILAKVNQTLR